MHLPAAAPTTLAGKALTAQKSKGEREKADRAFGSEACGMEAEADDGSDEWADSVAERGSVGGGRT